MADDRPILRGGEALSQEAEKVRGPGEKFHPQTFLEAQHLLAPMARELRAAAHGLPEGLRGERIVLHAKLLPNYLAASHHPTRLRRAADLVFVGTRAATGTLRTATRERENQPTKTLLLAATLDDIDRLEYVVTATPETLDDKLRLDIAKFDELGLPGPERVIERRRDDPPDVDPEERVTWEAVLHPAVDRRGRVTVEAQRLVLDRWRALVHRLEGEIHEGYVRNVGNLTFMPVSLRRGELEQVARFNALRVMRPMPRMRRLPVERMRRVDLGEAAPSPPDELPPADSRVAVFDGGVDLTHPLLAPFVTETALTDQPPDADALDHGTLVTSAALYGHMTLGQRLPTPPAHVDHYRVLPVPAHVDPDDEPYWVADQIEAVIRGTGQRLVVLSYGPDVPVDDDLEPDRFTTLLDQLAYIEGAIFATAVGNNGEHEPSPLGLDRVMAPADGVNVLAVGACDRPAPEPCQRAHYSAIGPGRAGLRIAPLGLSFGGSDSQEFVGLAPGGGFQLAQGTSFAAPTAARGIATLRSPLATSFSVNTARAFAAHFAAPVDKDRLIELGHGRLPEDYLPHLTCDPTEITVLVEDILERGQTKSYPFPLPSRGLDGTVELRWTVSFASPIDEEDAVEYTLAGLDIDFRPNSARFQLNPPPGVRGRVRDIDLRDPPNDLSDLVSAGWRLSTNARTRSGKAIRSEVVQRDEGKWETVVRHDDRLRATSLLEPEVWLTYYERAEGELVSPEEATALEFAVLLTIRAHRVGDLYDQIRADARYRVLQPIAVPAVAVRVR